MLPKSPKKTESARKEISLPDINRAEELIRLHAIEHKDELEHFRRRLIEEALKLVGTPSVKYTKPSVGKSPETGFDCSGFIVYLFNKVYPEFTHVPLQNYPRHSNKFFDRYGIFIPWNRQQAGDLMFIYRQSRGWYVDHMGIMIDRNRYIHAPGKDNTKVQILRLNHRWRMKNRDQEAHYDYNPVGFKRIGLQQGRWRIA